MERLGIGSYAFKRSDGTPFGMSPKIEIRVAPPKCDEMVSAIFAVCPLHELSCPLCCDEHAVHQLKSVPKYTPMVSAIGPRSFEILIMETVHVADINCPPKEPAVNSDADFYVMVSLPRQDDEKSI